MKKMLSAAAILAAAGMLSMSAFAEEVFVRTTISDGQGNLVVADELIGVEDADGDGTVNVDEVLKAAHDKFYDGGAEAGYVSEVGDYGLMITTLWGETNGGSYGYYVGDAAAMSLEDTVAPFDKVNAFVYTDLTTWSDTYCYFSQTEQDCSNGVSVIVELKAAGFDENWTPVEVPVVGAELVIDGEKTGVLTDGNGMAKLKVEDGDHILSAVSDTQTLVPPAYRFSTISAMEDELTEEDYTEGAPAATEDAAEEDVEEETEEAPAEETGAEETTAAGDVSAETDTSKGSPDTGIADVAVAGGIAVLAAAAFVTAKRK